MIQFLLLAALCADPDIEAMKRSLEAQISVLQRINTPAQKGGDPTSASPQDAASPGSGIVSDAPVVALPEPPTIKTGQCQCQSRGERACYCLRTGNKCYCPTRGPSTWELTDTGAPIRKVQKPLRREASAGDVTAAAAPDAPAASKNTSVPLQKADGKWWWQGPTGTWFGTATLTEGQTYVSGANRFVYRYGKMLPEMAADIAPKGHWTFQRRCVNGVCQMYRVWVSD